MVRIKNRWILFEIVQDDAFQGQTSQIPLDVDESTIFHCIRQMVATTYGDIGAGYLKPLQVKWFNPDTRLGIMRAPREHVDMLLSSIFFIKKVGPIPCSFRTLQVSGTLIFIQKYAIERDRMLYLEEQARMEKQGRIHSVVEKIHANEAKIKRLE
ncbi:hypothetical protein BC940DRAFT_310894 [Gongronella butleri]|nr:hypothetical protein BC940DRAFT_310894 [Gongronella butleri]